MEEILKYINLFKRCPEDSALFFDWLILLKNQPIKNSGESLKYIKNTELIKK
jgi:hypothetical protein